MLLYLRGVLTRDQLEGVRALLAEAPFVDGRLSAGGIARRIKRNEEVDPHAPLLERLNHLVMGALVRHPDYRTGALPLRVAAPYYARYVAGMAYGAHVDDPVMGRRDGELYRADVAITIFLSAPEEYDGGELVIRTTFGEQRVKLPAGDGVLYPATSLHYVAEVTRGTRLVAVTWAQSLVRDPARRELLYELNRVRERLLAEQPDAEDTARLNAVYVNLLRMWGEL